MTYCVIDGVPDSSGEGELGVEPPAKLPNRQSYAATRQIETMSCLCGLATAIQPFAKLLWSLSLSMYSQLLQILLWHAPLFLILGFMAL